GLAGPVAGLVVDDERRVDSHQAVPGDVRPERGRDRVVVGLRREVHQPTGVVEGGDPGGLDLTPREVDADEVHGITLSCARTRSALWWWPHDARQPPPSLPQRGSLTR